MLKFEYYKVLDISVGSDKKTITSAYRKLAKKYHPDLHPGDDEAEAMMKRINEAYSELSDSIFVPAVPRARTVYNTETEASAAMRRYFLAIQAGNIADAFSFVSEYDKRFVSEQSFTEWRSTVAQLFHIDFFHTTREEDASNLVLSKGFSADCKKITISILERNKLTGKKERYYATKHCINEDGQWRVLLGYRDLNSIVRIFDDIQEQYKMTETSPAERYAYTR